MYMHTSDTLFFGLLTVASLLITERPVGKGPELGCIARQTVIKPFPIPYFFSVLLLTVIKPFPLPCFFTELLLLLEAWGSKSAGLITYSWTYEKPIECKKLSQLLKMQGNYYSVHSLPFFFWLLYASLG